MPAKWIPNKPEVGGSFSCSIYGTFLSATVALHTTHEIGVRGIQALQQEISTQIYIYISIEMCFFKTKASLDSVMQWYCSFPTSCRQSNDFPRTFMRNLQCSRAITISFSCGVWKDSNRLMISNQASLTLGCSKRNISRISMPKHFIVFCTSVCVRTPEIGVMCIYSYIYTHTYMGWFERESQKEFICTPARISSDVALARAFFMICVPNVYTWSCSCFILASFGKP